MRNDAVRSSSSWLAPHGCSAFPNTHETTSNYSHARTHAHGAGETRGRDVPEAPYNYAEVLQAEREKEREREKKTESDPRQF
ncbi:hypothetical protein PUN28_016620 [Cardiocondyla obscurior]|uniref:Uncharacterized protein n=1 Tax=Cardiocondyla obscurior TaxID=286306 RepID=A0AAW2ERS2_9HYME